MVRKVKKHRQEMWIRTAAISAIRTRVGGYATNQRGSEPEIETMCWIELSGRLDEAVRDVVDIDVSLHAVDEMTVGTARPAAVGAIVGFRPQLKLVVSFDHRSFDRLWTMAVAGYLRYTYQTFTKPHYGTSLVTSVSFSTEREE